MTQTETDIVLVWEEVYVYQTETVEETSEPEEPKSFEEQIWEYLTEAMGYSPEVTAAIMGNISAECSFRPYIEGVYEGDTYYGLFMWNTTYCPEVYGLSWQEQIQLMNRYLVYQFKTYKIKMTASEFLQMTDVKEAALIFAEVFERCGSGSYAVRQSEAERIFEKYGR